MKITNKLFPNKKFGIVDLFAYMKGEFTMLNARIDVLIKKKIKDDNKRPLQKPYAANKLEDEENEKRNKKKDY